MACWCDSSASEDEHCVCWWVLGSGIERVYEGKKDDECSEGFISAGSSPLKWPENNKCLMWFFQSSFGTTASWSGALNRARRRRSCLHLDVQWGALTLSLWWSRHSMLVMFSSPERLWPLHLGDVPDWRSPFPGGAEIKRQIWWSKSLRGFDMWSSKGFPHLADGPQQSQQGNWLPGSGLSSLDASFDVFCDCCCCV